MGLLTRIIQLSDIHLLSNEAGELLGVNTQESFKAVRGLIEQEKEIDFLLLSGDLTQDGSEKAYTKLAELIKPLQKPAYWVPGNHDNANALTRIFPRETMVNDKNIVINNWQIILLNSQIENQVAGHLAQGELDFLQACLQKYPEKNAVVMFHHHPFTVGSDWLDKLGVNNAKMFWQFIKNFSQIKVILFGHVHQVVEQVVNGIACYSVPSTCIQFKPNQKDFALDYLPPGYRWIELYEDGTWKTGVKRVEKYIGHFEKDAKGY